MTLWVSFHEGRASRRKADACWRGGSEDELLFRETTEDTTACSRNLRRLSQQEGSEAKSTDEQQRPVVLWATSAPRASRAGMSSPSEPNQMLITSPPATKCSPRAPAAELLPANNASLQPRGGFTALGAMSHAVNQTCPTGKLFQRCLKCNLSFRLQIL